MLPCHLVAQRCGCLVAAETSSPPPGASAATADRDGEFAPARRRGSCTGGLLHLPFLWWLVTLTALLSLLPLFPYGPPLGLSAVELSFSAALALGSVVQTRAAAALGQQPEGRGAVGLGWQLSASLLSALYLLLPAFAFAQWDGRRGGPWEGGVTATLRGEVGSLLQALASPSASTKGSAIVSRAMPHPYPLPRARLAR